MAENTKSMVAKLLEESGNPLTDEEKKAYGYSDDADSEGVVSEEDDAAVEEIEEEPDAETESDEPEDAEEGEADSAEAEEPDEEPDEEEQPKKKLSKEERAIVAAKKANKVLQEELAELRTKLEEYESEKTQAQKEVEYSESLDEETAKHLAKFATQAERGEKQLTHQMKVLNFKIDNADILTKYPEAKMDVERVMRVMESADVDAETACKAMYPKQEPLSVSRARAYAKGEATPKDNPSDYSVSDTKRAAVSTDNSKSKLTAEERQLKQKMIKAGVPNLTDEEIIALRKE